MLFDSNTIGKFDPKSYSQTYIMDELESSVTD